MTDEKNTDAEPDEDVASVDEDEEAVHILPVKLYFQVFGMLLVLTVITVLVSVLNLGKLGLGSLAIGAALVVAVAKSGLVVGYFMHLKYDMRFYSLVFFSAVLFVGLFIGLTMVDLTTRQSHFSKEEGTFVKKREAQDKKQSDRWLKEARDKAQRPNPMSPPPTMTTPAMTATP
jgi:cytochrome c oxidase subunit 4